MKLPFLCALSLGGFTTDDIISCTFAIDTTSFLGASRDQNYDNVITSGMNFNFKFGNKLTVSLQGNTASKAPLFYEGARLLAGSGPRELLLDLTQADGTTAYTANGQAAGNAVQVKLNCVGVAAFSYTFVVIKGSSEDSDSQTTVPNVAGDVTCTCQ